MAIRKAAELLDRLPEYLAFETLSTAQMRALRSERAAVDDRLARLWKMDKDNGSYLTREQLIETSGRKHKSVRGLEAMLKRVGFPFLETPKKSSNIPHFPPLGSITVKAYQRALKLDAEKQKKMRLQ